MSRKHKESGFNSPFAAAQKQLASLVPPAPAPAKGKPATSDKAASVPAAARPATDAELLADELAGVTPMALDPRGRVRAPPPSPPLVSRRAADEAEAYAQLADLVDGAGPFSIGDSDEYVEFLAPGIDRRLLSRLRAGEYALQGHLDLHGRSRDEARAAVERFITESRTAGRRCVLVIHGRGLHSKDQIPVLKEHVKAWLERGRLGRQVLAFATARPCDGGAGAVYVLLRR